MNIGDKFGRWEVISEKFKRDEKSYNWYVLCKCSCGTEREVHTSSLSSIKNPSKSCGCLQKEIASEAKEEIQIGSSFNNLTILSELTGEGRRRYVSAKCSCGEIILRVRYDLLKSGHTKSCGCLQRQIAKELATTHGMCGTREHSIWTGMKQRCSNPNSHSYENYGGRGITYDPKWEYFEGFYADMGDCPSISHSLDRIDNSKGYFKDNCRWTDGSVQIHNQPKRGGKTSSRYKGVYYEKSRNKWVARIFKDNKKLLLSRHSSEIEAAKAYDDASEELYGDRPNNT